MSDFPRAATQQEPSGDKSSEPHWTLPELLTDLESGDYLYLTPKMARDLAAMLRESLPSETARTPDTVEAAIQSLLTVVHYDMREAAEHDIRVLLDSIGIRSGKIATPDSAPALTERGFRLGAPEPLQTGEVHVAEARLTTGQTDDSRERPAHSSAQSAARRMTEDDKQSEVRRVAAQEAIERQPDTSAAEKKAEADAMLWATRAIAAEEKLARSSAAVAPCASPERCSFPECQRPGSPCGNDGYSEDEPFCWYIVQRDFTDEYSTQFSEDENCPGPGWKPLYETPPSVPPAAGVARWRALPRWGLGRDGMMWPSYTLDEGAAEYVNVKDLEGLSAASATATTSIFTAALRDIIAPINAYDPATNDPIPLAQEILKAMAKHSATIAILNAADSRSDR